MTQKKTGRETQEPEARAKKDDEKLKPKEPEKKHEAKNGKEGDSVAKEKEVTTPQLSKERIEHDGEKSSLEKEKEVLQPEKGGNSNMYLIPIALVLSIIALVVSIMFAMSSKRIKQNGGKLEEQQLQLTRKLESSLVKMESAFQRLENIESKIADFDVNGKTEREKRGIIELKKALLSFQEARSLINDDEMVRKILKIEEDMKSTLILPKGKETKVENKQTDEALTTEVGEKPVPDEKELEEKIAESEIGKEEERKKIGEVEIIEAMVEIARPEEGKEETVTEVQPSETEERIEEKISEEITEPSFESVEEEIPLSEEKVKAE